MNLSLEMAVRQLGEEFAGLNWDFRRQGDRGGHEIISYWPGREDEDILICVLRSDRINEPFHRQDFFFFNFAYEGSYRALSSKDDNLIRIGEGECYIGQPYSGYALRSDRTEDGRPKEATIVGVLVRTEAFFREYLPTLSLDASMLRFFLEPQTNKRSEAFIHLDFVNGAPVRELLNLMIVEYAAHREDAQLILKPLVLALFMQIARRHREVRSGGEEGSTAERIERYIADHLEGVTLKELAAAFSYHPNYLSAMLREKTGRKFSEILLEKRMERASMLLGRTELTVEEIAGMVGYRDNSSFYKAFRKFYGRSPKGR